MAVKRNEALSGPLLVGACFLVGLVQIIDDDVGANLGRGDTAMPEELLDMPDRGFPPQQLGRTGMMQTVRAERVRLACR